MDKRLNFLSIALIDALEDENYECVEKLVKEHNADPNFTIIERHLAPIHFSCGMENLELAENVTELFLDYGANPNLPTPDDGLTPLHIAAMSGRQALVRMLLHKGADITIMDKENRTPLQYAVFDCHFEVIETIKKFIFEKKIENKVGIKEKQKALDFLKKNENDDFIAELDENKYTPNRINYNFDITSPYFVNITHRRKNKTKTLEQNQDTIKDNENDESHGKISHEPEENQSFLTSTMNDHAKKNLFELTEENLNELTKNGTNENSRVSLIQSWREKVQQSKRNQSILYHFDDLENLLDGIISDENVDFTNTSVEIVDVVFEKVEEKKSGFKLDDTAFGKLLNTLREKRLYNSDTSFATALAPEENKKCLNDITLIKSSQAEQVLYQMSEKYQYIDRDEGLVFFEEKLAMNTNKNDRKSANLNSSRSTISTQITVPSEYDTEALREELTKIGEPPGPITKTTKRLYTKRLIKYKRDPERQLSVQNSSNGKQIPNYSIELLKTVSNPEFFRRITEYYKFEEEMSVQFKNNHKNTDKKWREGNLKQSFIYFLIDPRISQNLPAKSKFTNEHETWKQFLLSIFYVGKGKSVRPYAHLYDAMKIHMRSKKLDVDDITEILSFRKFGTKIKPTMCSFRSPSKSLSESDKLTRILDIWKSEAGVICLHVFHNILPAEAYTREAAIIDTMGLQHLTNMKRGDYYGPASSWTMRKRKCLGVALLLKAMKIFLAEGESQLFPSDLI
ncbi:uncharacterized protein LOC129615722 [Condylostylus longicornis]|uniref:uncharacterized protein LOC129615722 n=1 Tax=Condylostylus longicornis TaxID=2530218 RepID=UPI00244DAA6C|nr:uncharacterized protein LOC129615722 [Condylostylus longicornis]